MGDNCSGRFCQEHSSTITSKILLLCVCERETIDKKRESGESGGV